MKKSEKEKGKERVNAQNKQIRMVIGGAVIAFVILIIIGFVFFNQSGAKTGNTVAVYYTGTLDDGTVFDSNVDSTPLVFTIGQGNLIPGFEEAVIGMTPGTTKTVHIPFEKAYGPYREDLVHVVDRLTLPADLDITEGAFYSITRSDGAVAYVKAINVTPSTVSWDENHELAGKDLTFSITLVEIA